MIKSILRNRSLSFNARIKRVIDYLLKQREANIQWKARFRAVKRKNPDLLLQSDQRIEEIHKQYWKPFQKKINPATLRLSGNISGILNPKIIPEELFISDIEPSLNDDRLAEFLSYKSLYNTWFDKNLFPKGYFHNINGEWLDEEQRNISFNDVKGIARSLRYPVVLKPNRNSYGGMNVSFPSDSEQLISLIENRRDFLVQEKIEQHPFFNNFNPKAINTIKINVYRSVSDNLTHVVSAALRMGVGTSLDNESSGGIVALIRKDGKLNGYAVNKYGSKFTKHPDTSASFDQLIPDFDKLVRLSEEICQRIIYARVICLDLCYDINGQWRIIEININSASIRFAQNHGALFFGDYTDEVYDYCLKNHWTSKNSADYK